MSVKTYIKYYQRIINFISGIFEIREPAWRDKRYYTQIIQKVPEELQIIDNTGSGIRMTDLGTGSNRWIEIEEKLL